MNHNKSTENPFSTDYSTFTEQGDRQNADAVLQVTMSANPSLFVKIRKEDPTMCEALRALMADDINAAKKEGIQEGIQTGLKEGQREGILITLASLVKDNLISVSEAARRADMAEDAFREKMTSYN